MKGKFIRYESSLQECYEIVGNDGFDVFMYKWDFNNKRPLDGQTIKMPELRLQDTTWEICTDLEEGVWRKLNGA